MDRVARARLDLDQRAGRGGLRDANGLGGAADLAGLERNPTGLDHIRRR
jgi:hypothetical protein